MGEDLSKPASTLRMYSLELELPTYKADKICALLLQSKLGPWKDGYTIEYALSKIHASEVELREMAAGWSKIVNDWQDQTAMTKEAATAAYVKEIQEVVKQGLDKGGIAMT